jgi:hypothetical protein
VAPKPDGPDTWIRAELMQLLSVSGSLAGLCVTVVALMHTFGKATVAATIVDDMFALCALTFLVCVYLIFSALRSKRAALARVLVKVVDVVFLLAFTAMTGAAFIMVYTVW